MLCAVVNLHDLFGFQRNDVVRQRETRGWMVSQLIYCFSGVFISNEVFVVKLCSLEAVPWRPEVMCRASTFDMEIAVIVTTSFVSADEVFHSDTSATLEISPTHFEWWH